MTRKLRSILLIDDDDITNYLHQMLLEELQATDHIDMVSEGEAGLSKIQQFCDGNDADMQRCPELILLDLNMPRMDGFDFLEEFQHLQFPQDVSMHVVVLTSSSNLQDMQKAQNYPIQGYINKPLTSAKLREILSQIADTSKD